MRSQSVCMCVQTHSGTNLTQLVLLSYPKHIHFQLNRDKHVFPDELWQELRMCCCDHQLFCWFF